jgi:SAM-dependent methyltransferase
VSHVHDAAARGFQTAAGDYERSRPDYPAEAVDRLSQELEIGEKARILDVGAGTGKLTRMLVPTRARLVALEPVEAMRATFAAAVPGVPLAGGTAEALPFADGLFDGVVAAQSFHWFQGEDALAEFHRVLRPAGRLGLIWNMHDVSVPWVGRLIDLLDRHRGSTPREWTGEWRRAFQSTSLFGTLNGRRFRNEQRFDLRGLVDRVATTSFIAALPTERSRAVLEQVSHLAQAELDERGEVVLPYNTELYWCARA